MDFRHCSLCVLGAVLLSQTGEASVCEGPGASSYASLGAVKHGTSAIEGGVGDNTQENQDIHVLARTSEKLRFGFSHRYTKFNFDGIEPQTNAHLHVLSFPVHWVTGDKRKGFRIAVAPTLSASSNVMGHPQEYRGDTLQLAFALAWQRQLSDRLSASYALCGDDRFGAYRIYPAVAFRWQPHPDWNLDLGFPSSSVSYEISEAVETKVRIAPDGSEWHVMGRDFVGESSFVYEAWALEWLLELQVAARLSVTASLGRQLRNRFEMTLVSGERLDVESESVYRAGAEIRWTF